MLFSYVALFILSFPMFKTWNKMVEKNKQERLNSIKTDSYDKSCKKAYILMVGGVGLAIQRWLSLILILITVFK